MSTLFGLQPFLASLGASVLCISGGMVLASLKSADFLLGPFMAVLGAGLMAATRWVTTERYMVGHNKRVSSMQLLYMLSPIRYAVTGVPPMLPLQRAFAQRGAPCEGSLTAPDAPGACSLRGRVGVPVGRACAHDATVCLCVCVCVCVCVLGVEGGWGQAPPTPTLCARTPLPYACSSSGCVAVCVSLHMRVAVCG
jgi:hypothetical protein